MCGRFAQFLPPEAVRALFGTVNELVNLPPSWNVAPSQPVMVVRRHPATGVRHLDLLSWGLVPHFTPDLKSARKPINARAETIATTAMFKGAYAARRCLVPADAFYEWRVADKQPFAIARTDGAPLAFAGLWEGWRGADGTVHRSFAVVTTAAAGAMTALHERVPVLIEPADWPAWLGEAAGDPSGLLHAPGEGVLRFWQVSKLVNKVRNNDENLVNEAPPS